MLITCFPPYLTRLKDSTDESDEVPLSKSLGSKSKGTTLPTKRRKGIQPQDEDEDELPRAHDEMRQKARRPSGAPGTSTAMRSRPANPILKNKRRRRLSSSEGESDEVSRWRQPQGHQTHNSHLFNEVPQSTTKEIQQDFSTRIHYNGQSSFLHFCGRHRVSPSQPPHPAKRPERPAISVTLRRLYSPLHPLQPLFFLPSPQCRILPLSRCPHP